MSPGGMIARRGLLLCSAAAVSGCGFRPVYGTYGGRPSPARHEMGLIDVANIPERSGQLLRQALLQRMTSTTEALAKQYQLLVSFAVAAEIIGVQVDTTVTRVRYTATGNWSLKRLDPASTLVTNGTARALDGINVIENQYFELDLAGETVQRRLADSIANQITLQLASYFARQAATG